MSLQPSWTANMIPTLNEQEQKFAARAYVFYTLNITFLPVLGFLIQALLWRKARMLLLHNACLQIRDSIFASIFAGLLLAVVSVVVLFIGGLQSPYTWAFLITYFTVCHSVLILIGVLGYARISGGKPFSFFHASSWWSS